MVFPDDEREANPASFKFLEMAHKWKRMQAAGGNSGAGGSSALSALFTSATQNGANADAARPTSEPAEEKEGANGSTRDSGEDSDMVSSNSGD